nr:CZB domain-containing protein [Desulfobulbaceae bacterium]
MFDWKNATLTTKIIAAFSTIIFMILLFIIFNYRGVNTIISNAEQVISGYSLDGTLAQKEIDHLNWVNKITALLTNDEITTLNLEVDDHKCGFGEWLYGAGRTEAEIKIPELAPLLKSIEAPHNKLHKTAVSIKEALTQGAGDRAAWFPKVDAIYIEETVPTLAKIQALIKDIRQEAQSHIITDTAMISSAKNFKRGVAIFGALFIAIGIGLAFIQAKGLNSILKKITDGLKVNAMEVSAAALEMSAFSQDLATSSAEQAATMQTTSTSLEEMTASSKETSALTKGSEKLMNQNIERSGQSLKALVELTSNMAQIEQDSDKIKQIINTIDSIAFQTNLLALNAAVEAARAGEAGAGFAVVAAEVKNLASRSTQSAKDTQELLDKTIQRVVDGTRALKNINSDFDEIVSTATGIGDKTVAITQATSEQAVGIEHITRATMEIDQTTQHVSATAAEAANAADKLTIQSEEMNLIVNQLIAMVYGKKGSATGSIVPSTASGKSLCWDVKNCPTDRRNGCPAYPNTGHECWSVTGTLCGGQEQGTYHEKMANCRKCNVYELNTKKQKPSAIAHKLQSDVTCWEMKDCPTSRRNSCPAYPDSGGDCWMVTGTQCGGKEQGTYQDKMAACRKCDVYKAAHQKTPQLRIA